MPTGSETKQLPAPVELKLPPGKRGKKRHPKAVGGQGEHQWGQQKARGQPAWLNAGIDGRVQCLKCGVEKKVGGPQGLSGDINADHAGHGAMGRRLMKGKEAAEIHSYIDAKGRVFQTMKELGCPAFILDEFGAIRENRQMVREVDDRVDYTDDRVDDVEERVESVEDRLNRLEEENAEMKAKLDAGFDVTAMVDWLAEMVAIAAKQKMETVEISIGGHTVAALPPPVANLIIDVGSLQGAQELAPTRSEATHEFVEVEDD